MIYSKCIKKFKSKQVLNYQWDWIVSQQRKSRTHQRLYNSTKPSKRINSNAPHNRRGGNSTKLIVQNCLIPKPDESTAQKNIADQILWQIQTQNFLVTFLKTEFKKCISEMLTCEHMDNLRLIHTHKSITVIQRANIIPSQGILGDERSN